MHDPEGFAATMPPGFTVGVSTAAFQIEGAVRDDGRGPSTWDEFMAQPGRISDGSNASIAADHYHRYEEDVALMKELGVDSYRFSLGWPRLQPGGRGPANPAGIAFYDKLLDELLAAGISPMATLFHWDMPEPLQHRGGWMNRDTAYRFADFALLAGESFGDRIDKWVTINEPTTVTLNGYALGVHAPGATLMFDALLAAHHQLLGHGLAVQALRSQSVKGGIGITNVHSPVVPAKDNFITRQYAEVFDLVHNRIYADPVLLGKYPKFPLLARKQFRQLIEVDPADLATIAQPLDFYGLNYYMPTRIAAGPPTSASTPDGVFAEGMRDLPFHLAPWPEFPATAFGWPVAPEFLSESLRDYSERYAGKLPPVFITEGGASYRDRVSADGSVDDADRTSYLAGHLAAAFAGVPGLDVQGYYVWTLMDNWEWAAGFAEKFGLIRVDPHTQDRTPKASYHWLRTVLRARR
ncbi:MAG: beta-glucosidase [Salinibacterium sp.]|nr:beta-glucosidase [Salinibacterium sp.]